MIQNITLFETAFVRHGRDAESFPLLKCPSWSLFPRAVSPDEDNGVPEYGPAAVPTQGALAGGTTPGLDPCAGNGEPFHVGR